LGVKIQTDSVAKKMFFKAPKVFNEDHILSNRLLAPVLFKFYDEVNQLVLDCDKLQRQLIPKLVRELQLSSTAWKREQGQISYADMIHSLWDQLAGEQLLPAEDQLLSEALRDRFRVVMIDEFQDTDRYQWLIFEHLFVHDPKKRHRLLVIGDPKQAIYGFRGADLHTYYQAVQTLTTQFEALTYRLATNYRTTAGLIRQLNRFFSDQHDGGWFAHDSVAVSAPSAELTHELGGPLLLENPTDLPELCCLDAGISGKADEIKHQLARQMVQVMTGRLLGQVKIMHKGQRRMLGPSDICVLLRSANDGEYLEQALREQGVPFTRHKKKDLYQSLEATEYQVLLTALSRPHEHKRLNNALLTVFFNLKPDQLADFSEERLPAVQMHWLQLRELAAAKDWVRFFAVLFEDMGTMKRVAGDSRKRTNLHQLKQQLLSAALKQNLTARGLLQVLLRNKTMSHEDEDYHQKDTELPAVRLMTKHISKGLEFPVVFLFGGFNNNSQTDKYYRYHDSEREQQVFDLSKTNKQAYQQAQLEEDRRLYYVAMTRAVFMLFLPYYPHKASDHRLGAYGRTVMARIDELALDKMVVDPDELPVPIPSGTWTDQQSNESSFLLPVPEKLSHQRRQLYSFSSLSQFKGRTAGFGDGYNEELTAELQTTAGQEKLLPVTSLRQQVPGGVKTGHVLHGIFENLDFVLACRHQNTDKLTEDAAIMRVVDRQMQQFRMDNQPLLDEHGQPYSDYRSELASWVWHTLRKPLDALGGGQLADIPVNQRQHELAFFWNRQGVNLTGFIDLFFAVPGDHGTDYYILDWKSNLSPQGYSPAVLDEAVMTNHQYHWQYQLYAMAMQHWFAQLQLPDARLKGALYLFSRGIQANDPAPNGVFYDDFSKAQWHIADVADELMKLAKEGRY